MVHTFFCLAVLLTMNECAASATAKVSLPAGKAPEAEEKEHVTERKQRVAAIREALPGVPKELVGIIGNYDASIDPVIKTILDEAKRWPEVLMFLYAAVKNSMPTQEKLEKKSKEGKAEYVLDQVLGGVASYLAPMVDPTNEPWWLSRNNYAIQRAYKALRRKYRGQWNQYHDFLSQGLSAPYGATALKHWQDAGFDQKPIIDRKSRMLLARMECSACKEVVNYPLPWMLPQYYHKRDCSKLEALQKKDPLRYRIVQYGEDIPQDASAYLSYTTLHLDIHSKKRVRVGRPVAGRDDVIWRTCWDLVIEYPAIIGFAEYVLECVVNGIAPEVAFKATRARMRDFYWPLRTVEARVPFATIAY